MRWFRRRVDVAAEVAVQDALLAARELEFAASEERWQRVHDSAAATSQRWERHKQINASARRIAEQLYSTYRLASIITNTPYSGECLENTDALLKEAVDVATKIADGLEAPP